MQNVYGFLNKIAIEFTQQRSRLLCRLPKQTSRNDKGGCFCGEMKSREKGREKRSNLIDKNFLVKELTDRDLESLLDKLSVKL